MANIFQKILLALDPPAAASAAPRPAESCRFAALWDFEMLEIKCLCVDEIYEIARTTVSALRA